MNLPTVSFTRPSPAVQGFRPSYSPPAPARNVTPVGINLADLAEPVAAGLTSTTMGIPAVVIALLPVLAMFVGIRLLPRLIAKFAR